MAPTDVVDLTFTSSSEDEAPAPARPPLPRQPPAKESPTAPLRRLLAQQNGGYESLYPPEPPYEVPRAASRTAAAATAEESSGSGSRAAPPPAILREPYQNNPYEPDNYQDDIPETQDMMTSSQYQSQPQSQQQTQQQQQQQQSKPKRSRLTAEEKEAAAEKKRREAAAKKHARQYNSASHVLRFLTVIIDPEVVTTNIGVKLLETFLATKKDKPENEHVQYKVSSAGLDGLPAIKWLRKVPSQQQDRQQDYDALDNPVDEGEEILVDTEEPHILICFEAEDFVRRVQQDELKSVFNLLSQRCPEHRPYFLIHRLENYLLTRERQDHKQTMRAGGGAGTSAATGGGGAGGSGGGFRRRVIDEFLARMTIECPQVGFRDVSTAHEGASHVYSLTKAIAQQWTQGNSDAATYLTGRTGSKKPKGTLGSLLASHPVREPATVTMMSALCALPSVGPQIAHAVATKHGSLGALMETIHDPGKTGAQKVKELESMPRTGGERVMKVGPKAAKQMVELLTSNNPDAAVKDDD